MMRQLVMTLSVTTIVIAMAGVTASTAAKKKSAAKHVIDGAILVVSSVDGPMPARARRNGASGKLGPTGAKPQERSSQFSSANKNSSAFEAHTVRIITQNDAIGN